MNDNKVATMSRELQLAGQTIVVLGGSSGMGFETAKQARSEGANVVLSGRNPTGQSRRDLLK